MPETTGERRESLILHNMEVTGVSRESAERAVDDILADIAEDDREEVAKLAKLKAEIDAMVGPCDAVLRELDELGTLTEPGARLYFAVERYLFPEAEAFRPENLEATERTYLKRAGL